MPSARQLRIALGRLPGVVVGRWRRGPEQPGWSVAYELLVATVRAQWNAGGTLAERRAAMDAAGRDELRRGRATFADATVAGLGAIWTTPRVGHDDAVVLYLHGGAYVVGSPASHRPITAGLAEAACARVVAVDYRLAPEHACPAAIDDAVAAFDALVADGTPPSRIVVAGDSAGGGLTVATLVALRRRGGPLPAAAVLLSPWLDLTKTNLDENQPSDYVARDADNADARSYASALPLDDPRVSPLHADLAGLPPLYVLAGGAETLRSDSERLARRADATGVPCTLDIEPGEVHVFPYFDVVNPRAVAAFRRIGTWVREQLGRAGSVQAA